MLALFPSTCAFFLSVASSWRVRSCKMLLFSLPRKRGHNRWQSWAVAESIATLNTVSWGSRLEITAPWSASRRMVWVHPICSRAKFISLIYAAAESRSESPAWLSMEARKKCSGGNHRSTGSCREAFLQQMSHPGLMRHKPYPEFLSGGAKPPLIRHKNGIVRLKKCIVNKKRNLC